MSGPISGLLWLALAAMACRSSEPAGQPAPAGQAAPRDASATARPTEPAASFRVLDAQASALRDQFNAGVGAVRVIMLVAPS